MERKIILWITISILLFGSSCRKDKDGTDPDVVFELPGSAFSAQIPTTVPVRLTVTDETVLESVSVQLVNDQDIPVAAGFTAALSGTSQTIERDLELTDERISSGNYKLVARASDGTNEGRAFRTISINAAPLRTRAVFITPPFGTTNAAVYKIDSVGMLSTFTTVDQLYGAAIDSYSQYVYLAGGVSGPMTAHPTANTSNFWQVANQNTGPLPYFTSLSVDPTDSRVYVCSTDRYIRGYNNAGGQQYTAQCNTDHRPYNTVVLGERVVTEERSNTLPQKYLAIFYANSGARIDQFPYDLETIGLERKDNTTLYIFGNRNGDGVIQERYMVQGGMFEMIVFESAPISAYVRLSPTQFIVATGITLKRFDASTGVATPFSSVQAETLALDKTTGGIYVGFQNQLTLLDPGTGAVLGTSTVPGTIGKILPLFNR